MIFPGGNKRWVARALACTALLLLYVSGAFHPIETELERARFQLVTSAPSGQIVIVAIDAESLRRMPVWPWPRQAHAKVIDTILTAGAKQLAINIDFSAQSTIDADRSLAAALERGGERVILPVFEQVVPNGTGPVVSTAPLAAFAQHARIASVNLAPDQDGIVRRIAYLAEWSSRYVPSLPQALTELPPGDAAPYGIDFGIDPTGLRVVSFADILTPGFDPGVFAGKSVIIGATAMEISNSFATPVDTAMRAPVLLALATETLLQGRALRTVPVWLVSLLAIVLLVAADQLVDSRSGRHAAAIYAAALAIALIGPVALLAARPVAMDQAPLIGAIVIAAIVNTIGRLRDLDLRIISQGLLISRSASLMRRVAEASSDGIVIIGPTGAILSANGAASRILGQSASELTGRNLDVVLGRNLPQPGDPAEQFHRPTESGDTLIIEATLSSVPGESDGTRVAVLRDVTLAHRREEALRRALRLAEAASRSKTQFLANMSHELRTPLNAIIGFSEVMRREMLGPIGMPQYQSYSTDIHDSAKHLLAIINDLLDISSIEVGSHRLTEESFDPVAACQSVMTLLADKARQNAISLQLDPQRGMGRLLADRRMLIQMLINLVANAIKFTPRGGSVTLKTRRRADGRFQFSVIDTGIGIAPDDLERVTKPFEQVEGVYARRHDGVGLGLSLVNSMIELHGGELDLRSTIGHGTTASIVFPLSRCGEGDHPPEAGSPIANDPAEAAKGARDRRAS